MSRPTTSRWTYDHLKPSYGKLRRLVRISERIALNVPSEATVSGVIVVERANSTPRAVIVELKLQLNGPVYSVDQQALVRISPSHLEEDFEHLVDQGVAATFDIDSKLNHGIRWAELRRRAVDEIEIVFTDLDLAKRSTSLDDPDISDSERVAILYHRALLADNDPNVLIATWFGISRDAAKQRLKRVRTVGLVPTARQGQRKATK